MKKILTIIGARPQFIKHAPVERVLKEHFLVPTVHTGQHYDENMSNIFFTQLKMNKPTYLLNVGSGGHGVQTGKMMMDLEPIMIDEKPDAVLIYGDTNSTLAGALVASKLNIPIIHVEAGLRSFNREMPEEINRIVSDHLSEILFAPSDIAIANLTSEGVSKNVFKIGDVMCDILMIADEFTEKKVEFEYYYVTLHRPYNTDNIDRLVYVLSQLNNVGLKVIFSVHPRTRDMLRRNNISLSNFQNIIFQDPVSYFDNVSYLKFSSGLITDSGGMQKEAYILKKKCVTIRTETEWVETLKDGWNHLLFENLEGIIDVLQIEPSAHVKDLYGDGKAAYEILEILKEKI